MHDNNKLRQEKQQRKLLKSIRSTQNANTSEKGVGPASIDNELIRKILDG